MGTDSKESSLLEKPVSPTVTVASVTSEDLNGCPKILMESHHSCAWRCWLRSLRRNKLL
jgi:hypothetical protein